MSDIVRNRKSCGCSSSKYRNKKKYNKFEIAENFVIGYTNKGKEFYIDIEDYEKVKDFCWCERPDGYIVTYHDDKIIRLHRFVMNAQKGDVVDHINHNVTDNRKENLRICTTQNNMMNSRLSKNSSTNITGVSYHKQTQKYRAYIMLNRKQIYLGLYDTIEEAKIVRQKAEIEYFGEYRYADRGAR